MKNHFKVPSNVSSFGYLIFITMIVSSRGVFASSESRDARDFQGGKITTTIETLPQPYCWRNQGSTSTCWLHSSLQLMEQMAGQQLSVDALLLPEIKSRALDRFLGHETPWDGGAGPTRPFALALEHGLVPESIWHSKKSIVQNYGKIFLEVEDLLAQFRVTHGDSISKPSTKKFLKELDTLLLKYTGTAVPKSFAIDGKRLSTVDYAREVIGSGASYGYDFRNIVYSEKLYGRMPEVAWTTIISRKGELKKITDIIPKIVERMTSDEAFAKAIEIFREGRPVAFTFIYANEDGQKVVSLNSKNEYYAIRPSAQGSYTSSHLVLISGIVSENGVPVAFMVIDPLASENAPERKITREFFETHGKTIHAIGTGCGEFL